MIAGGLSETTELRNASLKKTIASASVKLTEQKTPFSIPRTSVSRTNPRLTFFDVTIGKTLLLLYNAKRRHHAVAFVVGLFIAYLFNLVKYNFEEEKIHATVVNVFIIASVAEWSIAIDCKSIAPRATKVQILPGAQVQKNPKQLGFFCTCASLDHYYATCFLDTVTEESFLPRRISTTTFPSLYPATRESPFPTFRSIRYSAIGFKSFV